MTKSIPVINVRYAESYIQIHRIIIMFMGNETF